MYALNQIGLPFQLPTAAFAALPAALGHAIRCLAERSLSFPKLNALYEQIQNPVPGLQFFDRALKALNVTISLSSASLQRIPASGGLIVVANHPFGGLDGLILGALLQRVRADGRLLANYLLHCIPEMRAACFFVDPFGGPPVAGRNLGGIRAAARWVLEGGALGVFPAGEVAHYTLRNGCVTDPPWSETIARLVWRTGATVLPVFIEGQNSSLFQAAGLLHPRLRTALLPHELLRSRGRAIRVEIGTPISRERLARFGGEDGGLVESKGAERLTQYLRVRTYVLKGRCENVRPVVRKRAAGDASGAGAKIIAPLSPVLLAHEIAALPPERCLAQAGNLRVFFGNSAELPGVMREIGRLREVTFRPIGEGTGREVDLDRFDPHYLHLFVWDAGSQRIVGGYRMGQTDELVRQCGARGLYTSTLFDFHPKLMQQLDPALELGRSFVIQEFQRDYAPLSLLWKGIGRYVARNPKYRRLFGAVSISDHFQSMTKQLLMAFLKVHSFDAELAPLLRAKNPPKLQRFRDADERYLPTLVNDMSEVQELVGEIEGSRRAMPVLLRQYLKLNAKLLGFNIDPDFGDVLDGLVLVDLATIDRPILNRYLTPAGAAAFLEYHRCEAQPAMRS